MATRNSGKSSKNQHPVMRCPFRNALIQRIEKRGLTRPRSADNQDVFVVFDGGKKHINMILRAVKRLLERVDALEAVQRIIFIGQDSARGVIVEAGLLLALLAE